MLNLCHISSLKQKRVCAFALIVCLMSGLTPTAESVSVKLRGKIALGGILSGLAYTTYALVTRDKRATEKLQLRLGPPDRVVQFERGFDRWRIDAYGEQCYLFRNNLFIKTVPCTSPQSAVSRDRSCAYPQFLPIFHSDFFHSNFLLTVDHYSIDTPVSVHPKWLQLCLSRPQRVPRPVFSYLYQLEAERLLGPQL